MCFRELFKILNIILIIYKIHDTIYRYKVYIINLNQYCNNKNILGATTSSASLIANSCAISMHLLMSSSFIGIKGHAEITPNLG